ncbi:MAG: hypothetical protein RL068_312 [Actinomycetota bacterium]|jgi:hypothetical protein
MSLKDSPRELAQLALAETTDSALVGDFVSELEVEKNVIEVKFDCTLRSYKGWHWTVTLTQIDKRKPLQVSEINLLASEHALLAPKWVPWAERLAEFRKQLRAEGKANSDAEADALIEGMRSALADHDPANQAEDDSNNGSVKPPLKARVRQRRIKRNEDSQDNDPDEGSDQDG